MLHCSLSQCTEQDSSNTHCVTQRCTEIYSCNSCQLQVHIISYSFSAFFPQIFFYQCTDYASIKRKKKRKYLEKRQVTLKYILKPLCILQGFLLGTGNSQSKTKDMHQSYFCKGQGQTTLQEKRNKTIFFSNGHLGTGRRKFFRKILAKHIGGT